MTFQESYFVTRTLFPKSCHDSNLHRLNPKASSGESSVKEIITTQLVFSINPNLHITIITYNLTSDLPYNVLSQN